MEDFYWNNMDIINLGKIFEGKGEKRLSLETNQESGVLRLDK